MMNLPNKLTLARCVMALIFVGIMSFKNPFGYSAAYILFIAATLTDYYDGKIARERNLITNFGKLFDPVADKVLLSAAFIMLMTIPDLHIPGWTIVAILAREFLVTGARTLAAAEGAIISADRWGKSKTVLQMIYVFTFLFFAILIELMDTYNSLSAALPGGLELYRGVIGWASQAAIVLVAGFTVYSGAQFAKTNWKTLNLGGSL